MNQFRKCPTCKRNLTPGMFKPYERECASCVFKASGGQRHEPTISWNSKIPITTSCVDCGKYRAGQPSTSGESICEPCSNRRGGE